MLKNIQTSWFKLKGKFSKNLLLGLIILVVMLVSIPLGIYLIKRGVLFRSGASSQVAVSIQPSSATLPPDTTFSLMLNSGSNKIGFARVIVNFDTNKIRLNGEVQASGSLSNVVSLTSSSEANSTGKILIVLGLPPDSSSQPSGTFEIAKIPFKVQTTSSNQSTTVSIDSNDIQIVDLNANSLSTTVASSSLTLNPQVSAQGQIRMETSGAASFYIGEIFPVKLSFNTGLAAISSLSFRITYPYSGSTPELQVVDSSGNPINSLTPDSALASSGSWSFPVKSVTTSGGTVTMDFSAVNTDTSGYTSSSFVPLTTIYFKVNRAPASIVLAFDSDETMMMTKTEPITNILIPPSNLTLTLLADTTGPAPITDLAVTSSTVSEVSLTWTAPSDTGLASTVSSYDLRYSNSQINESNWDSATQVSGEPTPKNPGSAEAMTVSGLLGGKVYYFAIKSIDVEDNLSPISNVVSATTGNSTFSLSFMMQGISTALVNRSADVTLESSTFSKIFGSNFTSGSNGVFSLGSPIELSGVSIAQGGTTYDVFVKSPGRLRRKLGSMSFVSGANTAPSAWSSIKILAGDFDDNNILNIVDIGKMLSVYTALSVPVDSENSVYDIDANGIINITDVAIVLSNYTALEINGD
jgi:hypothetical protein